MKTRDNHHYNEFKSRKVGVIGFILLTLNLFEFHLHPQRSFQPLDTFFPAHSTHLIPY